MRSEIPIIGLMERTAERASFLIEILKKNQATLPPQLQRLIGAHQGDKLEFIVEDGNVVEVRVLKLVPRAFLPADLLQLVEKRSQEMLAEGRRDYTADQIMALTGKEEESVHDINPSPEVVRMVVERGLEMQAKKNRRDYPVEEIMAGACISNLVPFESLPKKLLDLIATRQSEVLAMKDRRDYTPEEIMKPAAAMPKADVLIRENHPSVSLKEP